MPSTYLSIAEVAALAGISPTTVRGYLLRGYLPEPDVRLGQSPGWLPETIRPWLDARAAKAQPSSSA